MQHKTRFLVALLSLVGTALLSVPAQAQDFPTHKGDNQRQGRNADPVGNSPGIANLRWWHPDSTEGAGGGLTRDNTSGLVTRIGTWVGPSITEEASYPYIPTRTGDAAEDARISRFFDPTSGLSLPVVPGYEYEFTVASRYQANPADYDPTVPESGTASTFTWDVTPTDPTPRNYGVWVWLPAGGTVTASGIRYPQRYFVYSVQYGSGQRFVDVVDTSISGTGWVRLGGGGAPTQRAFPYDGSGSMSVTLYNTIPRNSSGTLLNNTLQSQTLVYADGAALSNSYGTYKASPVISMLSSGAVTAVTAALNKIDVAVSGGSTTTVTKGIVTSYSAATGVLRWRFSPIEESEMAVTVDYPSSQVTVNPPDWTLTTTVPDQMGADCHTAPVLTDPTPIASATDVVYSPNLATDGDYDVMVWCAGSSVGNTFAREQVYEVHEGATVSTVYVDHDTGNGWVRLGARRWRHSSTSPLVIHALNYSNEPADAGRRAYADALRFVGSGSLAIDSTPVHVNGALIKMNLVDPPVPTDVTLVAAENGRIYCLDATGNGDGTTNVYWTYPSTPDSTNPSWTDPNQVAGLDGVGGVAEMPTHSGFDLSSALVQRVGTRDRLYIGARNGRVYCIDMTGRGDMQLGTRIPGTTERDWTYPDDFPATPKSSNLGAFVGSLAFATTSGGPTIFVPAPQGRIYALDAEGNSSTKTTTVRWMYPELTSPTLGGIVCTPAVDDDHVYFGTESPTDGARGEFYALDRDNGNVVWKFDGTTTVPAGDFRSSPALAPGLTQGDTVFVANENHIVYALSAQGNGDGTTAVYWSTDELGTGVEGSLIYVPLQVFTTAGAISGLPEPVVMLPTTDGRFVGLFAEQGTVNRFGTRRAWEYDTLAPLVASMANGRNWLVGGATDGTLYAFNPDAGDPISPGPVPGRRTIVENDPSGDDYRLATVKFISAADYKTVRRGTDTSGNPLDYTDLAAMASVTGNPLAFEWGETIYALVYNFPHDETTPNGTTIPPPLVNYAFSVEGGTVRNISVESRPVTGGPPGPISGEPLNGYTVLAYALQTGGQTSLAPGKGKITVSVTTGALNDDGARQNIALDPTRSELTFYIANPLALLMNGTGDSLRSIGYTVNPADPENLINGSAKTGSTTKDTTRLLATVGLIAHGLLGSTEMHVIDRSLMTLLRGPGRGLDNVRYQRNELGWSGGMGAVYKPLDPVMYPGYEDYPINYPNTSIDYPNIDTPAITVTKDPNGDVENPVFNGVSLRPPTIDSYETPTPATRVLNPTLFKIDVQIPRFQPANATPITDSAGDTVNAGYHSRQTVFVSGTGSGSAQRSGGRRDAYRTFILGGNVDIDERVTVDTPTVDAGSLAAGTGYSPADPADQAGNLRLNPLGGADYAWLFNSFEVGNPGNVNLRALHLAKAAQYSTGMAPWPIYSPANHELAWLDPMLNVFTTLDNDARWRVNDMNGNDHTYVVLQKARVGDRVPTSLNINTPRRANSNLGLLETSLTGDDYSVFPKDYKPMVAVTIPIGLPVGTYVQTMRIINEDDAAFPNNQALSLDQYGVGLETYSDPTFVLRFNVRETRLTNTYTKGTSAMIDDLMAPGTDYPFLHANAQPTAMRTGGGSVVVAWASTRPAFASAQPTDAETLRPMWQIYLGSLVGANPGGVSGVNPLRELNYFTPNSGSQWFQRSLQAPYPTCQTTADANALFDVDTAGGSSVLFAPANTVNFGSPAFPTTGFPAPDGAGTYMAFVGEAQIQTPTGRVNVSRLFLGSVNVDGSGVATLNPPVLMRHDDGSMRKGKPSVVQTGSRATVFFSANAAGQPQLFYTTYNPAEPNLDDRWTNIVGISLGSGFESASSPSVFPRDYVGATLGDLNSGDRVLETTFVGKLRGRPNSEVFMGRLFADGSGVPLLQGGRPRFAWFPARIQEPLVADGSLYRAQGVVWNMRGTVRLEQILDGVVTDLEITDAGGNPTTRTFNSATGLLSFDTKLGGKVYVDPNMGTVRFSTATLAKRAKLLLTYQPQILRVSGAAQNAAHTSPTTLFDHRLIGEASYWVNASGLAIDNSNTEDIRSDRFVFTYGRAAAGAGQTARPYMRTMRFGVQLPTAIYTQPDGRVVGFTVAGAGGAYQIDPANGRVYFTGISENREVTITYPAANEAGDSLGVRTATAVVTLVPEAGETPIAIEQAVNEAAITSILDPFDPGGAVGARRPGLIWLFWQSTRGGSPDLYFETIAPRLTPLSSAK